MTFDDFDKKLKQAFEETREERAERLMTVEKKHRFSLAYRIWERKMLRDLRRNRVDKRWTLRRAKYAVAAMATALALLIGGTTYAAIYMTGRFSFEERVDYSKLLIDAHPSDKTTFEEYYGLAEEDGWEITYHDLMHFETTLKLKYQRGDTTVIFFQNIIHEGNMRQFYDKEADFEMLSLYSENDGFLVTPKEGDVFICWVYDGYYFEILGDFNKEEAINLVYSTKVIDFTPTFI